ncbi:MAG: hypothetical protein JWP05_1940, partial [Microbacteriaceae bacterium]|nr:hypothetical protein [Microbacteriaceae bacterium]
GILVPVLAVSALSGLVAVIVVLIAGRKLS